MGNDSCLCPVNLASEGNGELRKLYHTAEELFEGDFNSFAGMAVEDTVAAKFVYDSWSAGN